MPWVPIAGKLDPTPSATRTASYAISTSQLSRARDHTTHELRVNIGHGGWIHVACRKWGASRVLHAWTYSVPQRRWEGDRAPTEDRHLLAAIMQRVEESAANAP